MSTDPAPESEAAVIPKGPRPLLNVRDDLAYVLPMAVYLAFMWAGGNWKSFYPLSYVLRTVAVATLLVLCWRHYTKVRWDYWWVGILLGIVGFLQWVPMQLWLQQFSIFAPGHARDIFNPYRDLPSNMVWPFIAVRLIGAVLIVPVMEELFWRDFLWRQLLSPNYFKLASVGEWALGPIAIVTVAFASVHGHWCVTAAVWGAMIAALLIYTKSLGACILMHATTNLLLGIYVLWTRDWSFW